MPKFRKKPVVIEAVQWTGDNWDELQAFTQVPDSIGGVPASYAYMEKSGTVIYVQTLEGEMVSGKGAWIIKGVNGEFYPCKDDIFQKTYDPVE